MNEPQPSNPAEVYERYFVPGMFLPWARILMQHAAPRSGDRVLDIACGTGVVAREAAPLVGPLGQVVAVDMSAAMLAVARSLPAPTGAPISWQQGSALTLLSSDGAFDLVLCQHGLPFFPDRLAATREMRRVLRAGGRALAIVLQDIERHAVFEALMRSVARHLSVPLAAVAVPFASSDAAELRTSFTMAGFEPVEIVDVSITAKFPDPDQFVARAVTSSAAAVPAFAALEARAKAEVLRAVRVETDPVLREYCASGLVSFPMFAQIAIATA
ncbi:MAG: methyltransferase domain-containing protein [Polyangiaceae bacterium]